MEEICTKVENAVEKDRFEGRSKCRFKDKFRDRFKF